MVKKNGQSRLNLVLKYLPVIFLCAIILLGAYLRFYKIADYMTFLGDEGRDVLVVKRMIVDHKFTLLGPTASVGGFFLGPIYYYFMLPFLWLFNLDPVGPAVMVAIFGTTTVLLIYLLGKRLFNVKVGLISSLLYAISPVVINYSRSSWNPNIVPFFTCLLILLLLEYAKSANRKYLFLAGCMLGIGLQLHYLFSFLIVFSVLFIASNKFKENIPKFAVIASGFFTCYFPFILFELRHGFMNTTMILKFIFGSKDTGFEIGHFVGNAINVYMRIFQRLVTDNNIFLAVILVIVSLFMIYQLLKNYNTPENKIILMWLTIPILLFGLYKKPIYDYYFGIIFPIPFLLTGLAVDELNKRKTTMIAGVLLVTILLYVNWQSRPFLTIPNRQLAQTKEVSKFIFDKVNGRPFNFAIATAQNSDHAYRYFFEIWGNKAVVLENKMVDPGRKTVTDQLFIICELVECNVLGNPLWEIAGFGRADIENHWKVSVLDIYKLVPYKGSI